jgi:hypothetical protein
MAIIERIEEHLKSTDRDLLNEALIELKILEEVASERAALIAAIFNHDDFEIHDKALIERINRALFAKDYLDKRLNRYKFECKLYEE